MISSCPSPSYTQLINLVAQRSSLLLAGTAAGSAEYMSWVRALERDFDVSIEVRTIMGPDNRPAAIGGTIKPHGPQGLRLPRGPAGQAMPPDCHLAFTVDADETRCAVRYC